MKILLSILAILALVFLMGCSARDTGNISKKELESLASKYGGVYIFDKNFYEEIVNRERERKELKEQLRDSIKTKLSSKVSKINMKPIGKKLPQTLSNGKRYYTDWTDPKFKFDNLKFTEI
ncbi:MULTISPECIES: hypothetical protein [Campylobacter]|jgi:hypothetical protein|uniref:hypothetical protein n=1 Tax=Campylobacter TaxID=194 RepID=UPI00027A3474|nr:MULTISPECIES: hypothetical protein [Campylobacter]EJP76273.1 putative lipoprotein [Campylobacter sp. FOBRC14]